MKFQKALVTALALLLCATYLHAAQSPEHSRDADEYKRVVWVDENGVKHVTLISPRPKAKSKASESSPGREKKLPSIIHSRVKGIDGPDKIILDDGRTVAYIGLEGPSPGEKGYKAAVDFHRKLVKGKWVNILTGPKSHDSDGNILGKVFINKLTFVNADLIRKGHARARPTPPNTEYKILFGRLEKRARNRKLGIWKN